MNIEINRQPQKYTAERTVPAVLFKDIWQDTTFHSAGSPENHRILDNTMQLRQTEYTWPMYNGYVMVGSYTSQNTNNPLAVIVFMPRHMSFPRKRILFCIYHISFISRFSLPQTASGDQHRLC